ncbi:hypothetical protein TrLO_g7937 [Triparma laevis f. longispina]|uniref:GP-PDE domain-containing protein n=1 Tax=Triparma laevis f. longispina TaxID=1714387 RepID=A0A9W7KVM1_9STRA|nr:hypothetical protein TrLO_g7937 [Triparma laevis f. longispina]
MLVYFAVSAHFLRRPAFQYQIEKNKCVSKQLMEVVTIAHRGSKREGELIENSMAAFKSSVEAGIDMIELDVWLTSDGEVVVFHDPTFDRVCQTPGRVNETKFVDLPTLKNDSREDPIPKLEDVLDTIGDRVGLIIEFKQDSDELIRKAHEMLQRHQRTTNGTTIWFSLKNKINKKLQKYDKTIPCLPSIIEVAQTYVLYYLGIFPFVNLPYNVFGFPSDEIHAARLHGLIPLPMVICRAIAWAVGGKPARLFRTTKVVDNMRRRGMPTYILGVNDEDDIFSFGLTHATGGLTDRPKWMLANHKKKMFKSLRSGEAEFVERGSNN